MINVIAAMHAWRFTHFTDNTQPRIDKGTDISLQQKLSFAFTGVPNTKPVNTTLPAVPYESLTIQSNVPLSCWHLPLPAAKGTVILFHGYGSNKSQLLERAYLVRKAGYEVLLADFMGAGGSGGNQVTIGYKEAENVKSCYDYIRRTSKKPVVLMGSSMGAAAILRYIQLYPAAQPEGIVLECPFGTMYETVCARFRMMHFPTFPMAGLLLFWGGVENGFNAFRHDPATYAKSVQCPSLLLYGAQDDRVTLKETNDIFNNLGGAKQLKVFPSAGHNISLQEYGQEWEQQVNRLLSRL